MKRFRRITCLAACLFLAAGCMAAGAEETADENTEQGLDEIIPLIEMSKINETEGMSLEEVTDAYTEKAMGEYLDSVTGFSMQYPLIFQFDEYGTTAATGDGKATMSIDNMSNETALDENALIEAIRLEIPDIQPQKNEQNGCLRFDRNTDNGQTGQTDLYLLTEKSFHHITLRYPAAEKDIYDSYIEYMINTMETSGTDLG